MLNFRVFYDFSFVEIGLIIVFFGQVFCSIVDDVNLMTVFEHFVLVADIMSEIDDDVDEDGATVHVNWRQIRVVGFDPELQIFIFIVVDHLFAEFHFEQIVVVIILVQGQT